MKYLMPDHYRAFFNVPGNYGKRDSFWEFDIEEKKATCHQCIEAPKKYEAHLKCCTFWPFLPNYTIGYILKQKSESYQNAQVFLRRMIKEKRFALPIGLVAPPWYQKEFLDNKDKIFGKSEKMLCPYYQTATQSCGIWRFRGSVCTSFYCKSSYAQKGQLFWKHLEDYLSYLEMALAEEVLVYHDYSPRELSEQLDFLNIDPDQMNLKKLLGQKSLPIPQAKKLWKHYWQKEEEFYIKAAEFVDELPLKQIKEIQGALGTDLLQKLLEARDKIEICQNK